MAPGTALAQKRAGGRGITIVTGGDAGTAEGDFATCLVWARGRANRCRCSSSSPTTSGASRRTYAGQHGEKRIADRGKAFGMRVEDHRRQRPGGQLPRARRRDGVRAHASASRSCSRRWCRGSTATRRRRARTWCIDEADCLVGFERRLEERGLLDARADGRAAREVQRRALRGAPGGQGRAAAARRARSSSTHVFSREGPGARDGDDGPGHPHGAARRRGAPRRDRHLRRGRRPAARRRLHGDPGPQERVELAARRARHRRRRDRARRSPAPQPVAEIQFCDYAFNTIDLLKLAGITCWASNGELQLPDGADDAGRLRHPRQHLPLALVRRDRRRTSPAGRS